MGMTLIRRTARLREAGPHGLGRGTRIVRRGGISSPADLPGLIAWFDAGAANSLYEDAGLGTPANDDADVVGSWRDLSDAENHAAQGTATNKPTRQNAEVNSLPVVRFDGSNDRMQIPSLDLSAAFAIFIVHKTAGDGMFLSWSGGNHQVRIGEGGGNVLSAFDGTTTRTSGTLAIARTEWALVEYLYDGTSIAFYQNGVQAGSPATFDGFSALNVIGIFPGDAVPLNGDVAEIIISDAFPSTANRQGIEQYAATKYGW